MVPYPPARKVISRSISTRQIKSYARVSRFSMDELSKRFRPCVPAALLKTLDENELDPEERAQRCRAPRFRSLENK